MLVRNHQNKHIINENIVVSSFVLFRCKSTGICILDWCIKSFLIRAVYKLYKRRLCWPQRGEEDKKKRERGHERGGKQDGEGDLLLNLDRNVRVVFLASAVKNQWDMQLIRRGSFATNLDSNVRFGYISVSTVKKKKPVRPAGIVLMFFFF